MKLAQRPLTSVLILAAMVVVSSPAFARTSAVRAVPSWLSGIWIEPARYQDQEVDKLSFTADGRYFHEITRELGQYGTYIPYPTPCRHFEGGRIVYFGAPSKDTVDTYIRSKRQPPAFTVRVKIEQVDLVTSKNNGVYCPDWLLDAKGRVTRGESYYEWHFSAPNHEKLVDPWREIEFSRYLTRPVRR